jgi:hypothetical protein
MKEQESIKISQRIQDAVLVLGPYIGNEGKYYLDVTVKSKCVSESETIEVGVLPKV